MAEGDKKKVSSGNYRPQSAITIGRNKRLKGERHARRMAAQVNKRWYPEAADGTGMWLDLNVPRGTARNERRKPLQQAYARKLAGSA